jgi:hypothetical protein
MTGKWEDSIEPPCTSYFVALIYEGPAGRLLEVHWFAVSGLEPLTHDEAKARADAAIREEWAANANLGFDPVSMSLSDWNCYHVKTKAAAA